MHPFFETIFALSMLAPCFVTTATASADDHYDCSDRASAIVKQAYPFARAVNGGYKVGEKTISLPESRESTAVMCRVWLSHPHLTLAAIPLMKNNDGAESDCDIELLVLDSTDLAVRGRILLSNRASDQGAPIDIVSFDDGEYQLSADTLVFGFRVKREKNYPTASFQQEVLSLFAFANGRIKPPLDRLVTLRSSDESGSDDCTDQSTEMRAALSLTKLSHHGYRDIDLREANRSSRQTGTAEHCSEENAHSIKHHQLIFDGTHYAVPDALHDGN
ncbi:hypothetical protein [Ochrobactrum quorumnocens]|uniref:Secreted protein n=1 Tax=Ochrobactrum quorumnocens TaxID=271865 RepID=A0A5N1JWK2_9HYPH|nr:hypothetical protein [[Ochrobactrum] quorumnocens]KAA9368253.1 hypothetical protein F3W84_10200 [[Ochrobactrum] quorumnocens]MBD7991848.1 hypothetical protein [Ochrobactrum gallinarum]